MLRHVSLFSFTPESTPAQRQAVGEALMKLPALIAEVRDYRYGPDAGVNAGNFDYAVVADFDDTAGYLVYRDHPEHRRVLLELIAPIITTRAAVQFVAG